MSDWFLGEIRAFSFDKIPAGWIQCQGQSLPITGNQALFAVIGNQFGGDGKTNFNVPDLRGRAAIGAYTGGIPGPANYTQGKAGGAETVVLTAAQVPTHIHFFVASADTGQAKPVPTGNLLGVATKSATAAAFNIYAPVPPTPPAAMVALAPAAVDVVGGNGGHENRQPLLALNFCIATTGIFPPHQQ